VRISVLNSKELLATVLALRDFDRTLQGTVRKVTRIIGQPEWQKAVAANATTRFEQRVLGDTARMAVSNQNVTLKAGHIGRKLRGGGRPAELFGAAEFGGNRPQFRRPNRKGYAVYPAAARMIPRFAALWAQTTVRTIHEALEAKRG
jgi:hypothetical protein